MQIPQLVGLKLSRRNSCASADQLCMRKLCWLWWKILKVSKRKQMIVIEPNIPLQSISYTHKIVSGTADIKEGKKGREGVTQQQ